MAYYPIKCPYCLLEMSNHDVRFNLRTGTVVRTRDVSEEDDVVEEVVVQESGFDDDEYNDYSGQLDDDDDDVPDYLKDSSDSKSSKRRDSSGSTRQSAQTSDTPSEGLYTYAALVRHFGEKNVVPLLNAEIYAPPAFANRPEYREELLVGVEINVRRDGKEVTTVYRRRFCECEKELMAASGMKASYVILLLGPTSSGKTMYIIALHKALRQDGGFLLPPRGAGAVGLAKLMVTVLSGGRADDTSLKQMSDDLFDEGKLPLSTFNLDNEPLVLDVRVEFRTGRGTNALLFLRDIPGEHMSNVDRTEMLDVIAGQFPKFDGFIMMIDPFTFQKRFVFQTDGNADTTGKEKQRFVENLDEVLTGKIGTYFGGKKIDRPTAVIITKSDHLFNRSNIMRLENEGVKRSFPTLTTWQKVSFDRQYFSEIDNDVRRILSSLSPNVMKMLDMSFGNTFFALASALSKTPMDIEFRQTGSLGPGNYVTTPNAINPWRVADAFIRMLMKLNIVPPFDECEIRRPDLESQDALISRNMRYVSMINMWGRTFCNAWSDIGGMWLEDYAPMDHYMEMHEPPVEPKRTGFFGKIFGG